MKFFVLWHEGYDGDGLEEFSTEKEVLDFLNTRASRERFGFTVIEGRLVDFEPAEVVKAYKRKSQ
jgi:hypothetical protein